MQLLQLIDGRSALPAKRPAIIGSDVIAYAAGAKLCAAGRRRRSFATDRPGQRPSGLNGFISIVGVVAAGRQLRMRFLFAAQVA